LPGEVGGTQLRHHVLRQHHLRHVDSLPVRYHGGMDANPLLGESIRSLVVSSMSSTSDVNRLFVLFERFHMKLIDKFSVAVKLSHMCDLMRRYAETLNALFLEHLLHKTSNDKLI
jgi:hypothetical protein